MSGGGKIVADKKAKEIKNLVEAILVQKGVSYEEWLYQRHLECLAENSETVLSALRQQSKN